MSPRVRLAAAALLIFCSSAPDPLFAQSAPAAADTKQLRALTIEGGVRVDGTMDEPLWQNAEVISDFIQQEPNVGQPVSERTEVRVLIDGS